MNQINAEEFEKIICVITKECIDNSNFDEVQGFYETIMQEPLKFENKLYLMIEGYDNDSRELCEIEEVRAHFSVLDRMFPYWFYFLDKKGDKSQSPLGLIISLLVPIERMEIVSGKKHIQFDMEKFTEFMDIHFFYLNELTDKLELSIEENKRISNEIYEYLHSFV